MEFGDWLDEIGSRLDRPFSRSAKAQLTTYIGLLRVWNERINLTAIVDDEGVAIRHILDSLMLLAPLEAFEQKGNRQGLSLIDIGTGAGFPGLPLKIVRPDWQVLLLDSLVKRLNFLDAVIDALRLEGVRTRHDRAEDGGHRPDLREQFDVATARAVAPLPVLCEYCLPFVRVGGLFMAMKGNPDEEWPAAGHAVRLLGGELEQIVSFRLPGTSMQRSIIQIRKTGKTPPLYPRKAGKPEKQPL